MSRGTRVMAVIYFDELGYEHPNFFSKDERLGTFRAAVRTEMLTHQRFEEGDTWNSGNLQDEGTFALSGNEGSFGYWPN